VTFFKVITGPGSLKDWIFLPFPLWTRRRDTKSLLCTRMKGSWHRKCGTTGKSEVIAFAKGDTVWQFAEACYYWFWAGIFCLFSIYDEKKKRTKM